MNSEPISASLNPGATEGVVVSNPRDNHFNFLRLVLATLVIVSHSPELIDENRRRELLYRFFGGQVTCGEIAVDGFFLLSGFLILKSWISLPRFWPYLSKRVLRIYPGFLVAFLTSVFVFGPLGGNEGYWQGVSLGNLLQSWLTLGRPLVNTAFPDVGYHQLNGSLWTIRYEFLCYLGIAVLGLTGLIRLRFFVLGLFVVFTTAHLLQLSPFAFRSLNERYWPDQMLRLFGFFLAGSCFALFDDVIRYTRVGVVLALALLIPSMFYPLLREAALPILGGYLLFAAAFAKVPYLRAFGRHADVSYGVYLYAWPIQSLIITRFRQIDPSLLTIVSFALSYIAGFLSWHLVESPFLRLKPRRSTDSTRLVEEPAKVAGV